MFEDWIREGGFKAKYRYEWRIDYNAIAITSKKEVVSFLYEKDRKEWHVAFNGVAVFYVTVSGETKFRDTENRDYEIIQRFIDAMESSIKTPKETRRHIAEYYIEKRRLLEIKKAKDMEVLEKRGCILGLPITIENEDRLKSIEDEKLPMFVFGGIYRMADGNAIPYIYELVLNEILRRESFFEILIWCLGWADEYIVKLNRNDLNQTRINLLDSAIDRAKNDEQREAVLELRRSYRG